jgi:hypothetical protein
VPAIVFLGEMQAPVPSSASAPLITVNISDSSAILVYRIAFKVQIRMRDGRRKQGG